MSRATMSRTPMSRALLLIAALLVPLAAQAAPRVATDIAPVQALVAQVMRGVGTPGLIVPPGASPHHYALRPSQAGALANAGLVVWVGPALEPWFGKAARKLAPSARTLALLDVPGTHLLPLRQGVAFDAHDNAHADDHDHDPAGPHDPHAWLDPGNAALWLGAIAAQLSDIDPAHAATYAANARQGRSAIAVLDARLSAQLAPLKGVKFLVAHDAYQYFGAHFGLPATAAVELGDATDPGPARISALRDLTTRENIACVFAEPQANTRLVDRVFGDVPFHDTLDPLGSAHAPGAALYPALLQDMADALTRCATRTR